MSISSTSISIGLRLLTTALLLTTVVVSTATTARLKGEVVTWGTFQFVRSVGASLSHAYFATTDGVVRYNKLERRWDIPLTGADGLDGSSVRRLWPSRFDDHLFAQTDLGYFEFDPFFDRWYPRTDLPSLDTVYRQIPPPLHLIPPMGFHYFGEGTITDMAGLSVSISDVVEDNTGDLWIGTWGLGPACARGGSVVMEFLNCGLLQSRVDALVSVDSIFYVAGQLTNVSRTGITLFDTANHSTSFIEGGVAIGFPQVGITALSVDDTVIYAGTPFGLLVMDRNTGRVLRTIDRRAGLADDSVICLTKISDSLFIGTAAGLSLYHADTIRIIAPRTIGSARVFHLEPQDSNLWIASDYGAFRLNRTTGEIARFLDPGQFTTGRVYDIQTSGRFLWMSADNGLLKINLKTAKSEPLRLNFLPNRKRPLVVNDEIAAVASDRGLTLFHHRQAKPTSREFTTLDGLPSERINCLYLDGDYIWIGSDSGLTHFWWNNPDRVD